MSTSACSSRLCHTKQKCLSRASCCTLFPNLTQINMQRLHLAPIAVSSDSDFYGSGDFYGQMHCGFDCASICVSATDSASFGCVNVRVCGCANARACVQDSGAAYDHPLLMDYAASHCVSVLLCCRHQTHPPLRSPSYEQEDFCCRKTLDSGQQVVGQLRSTKGLPQFHQWYGLSRAWGLFGYPPCHQGAWPRCWPSPRRRAP